MIRGKPLLPTTVTDVKVVEPLKLVLGVRSKCVWLPNAKSFTNLDEIEVHKC